MYEQFYGFSGRPFQLTPDPQFYFESTSHKKAMSYLGYGLAQGEGFIVITGEVGAGKSTLVAHLMRKVDPRELTVGQIVTSNLDGEEMIHVAAQAFGIEVEGRDKAATLGAIEAFLQDEARAGRRCLLVVDESQNLSVEALEELRMLSNFQLGAHPLLQTLLLGQPEFKRVLAAHDQLEQLRQRVIAAHHLDPVVMIGGDVGGGRHRGCGVGSASRRGIALVAGSEGQGEGTDDQGFAHRGLQEENGGHTPALGHSSGRSAPWSHDQRRGSCVPVPRTKNAALRRRPSSADAGRPQRRPVSLRAITRRWISLVPS